MAANPNINGLHPIARLNGGPFGVTEYGKPASEGTYAIYIFDVLMPLQSSVASPGGNNAPGCKSGYVGSPGTGPWLGVSLNYSAVSVAALHYVVDDPQAIFLTQFDDDTVATSALHGNRNTPLVNGVAGNTTTHISKMSANHTGLASTSTLDLHILRVSNMNASTEAKYGLLEVQINIPTRQAGMVAI
jgi:hypothetical protein